MLTESIPPRTATPAPAAPDARAQEILAAAKRAFLEKGFDGASMQDLARAAGMSAGNFYRYFPSKAAIVEAIVSGEMAQMAGEFSAIVAGDDLLDGLRRTLAARIDDCAGSDAPLWADIEVAARRSPEIAATLQRIEGGIDCYFTDIFARATGLGPDEAQARFTPHATMIVLLFKATAIRLSAEPSRWQMDAGMRASLRDLALRTIDGILGEIRAAIPAGQGKG